MEQPARPTQPDAADARPGGPAAPPPLQRSASNRIIGGVCGGLAERTDIDPIIYRVLVVVLTLVGGAGLILYGAAMLVIPDARTGKAPLDRVLSGGPSRGVQLAGVLLLVVVALVVLGGLTGVFGGSSISIVVIALLAVLVAHRRGYDFRRLFGGGSSRTAHPPDAPRPPAASARAAAPVDAPTRSQAQGLPPHLLSGPPRVQAFAPPPAGPPPRPVPPSETPTVAMPAWRPPPAPPYVDLATVGAPPPPPRPRIRPRSITFLVWLLAATAGGVVFWLQQRQVVDGDLRIPLAVALGTLGLGLVVSTWVGRAGVKGWGVLLTIALGLTTVFAGFTTDIRVEPVTWKPTSAAQLERQQPYEAGVSSATLDLTHLPETDGVTYPARVRLSAGQIIVLVPRSATVDVSLSCTQCVGNVLGQGVGGNDRGLDRTFPPEGGAGLTPESGSSADPKGPVIDLSLSVSAGNVEVRRAG
ncbi:MAG: PspC domain-containing protein [Streptosporangiales bacterium]|nr:PspC domain-containing protein [Streptosporangiales bacterium]